MAAKKRTGKKAAVHAKTMRAMSRKMGKKAAAKMAKRAAGKC